MTARDRRPTPDHQLATRLQRELGTTTACARVIGFSPCTQRDRHLDACAPADGETCPGCLPRPAEQGSPMCARHGEQLTQGIAEMPALALELGRGLAASAGGVASGAAKMDGSPDFARARAMVEHVGQLAHDLSWLAREVAELRSITHPTFDLARAPMVSVQRAATWLTTHATWMLTRVESVDWAGTIAEGRSAAYRLIDRPPRTRFDLPDPCPGPAGGECGAKLTVSMYDVGDPRTNEVWCAADPPHRFESHQWLRLGQRLGYDRRETG